MFFNIRFENNNKSVVYKKKIFNKNIFIGYVCRERYIIVYFEMFGGKIK